MLAVIGELGFVRNGSASRLRSSRNTAPGLVVIDVGNPFFTEVVRGAERLAEQLGYVMLLCDSESTIEREARHLRFLEEHRVAGILITPTTPERVRPLLRPGETVGLVGESGSGKATLGRAVLGLAPMTAGAIALNGREIAHASRRERRDICKDVQVVFRTRTRDPVREAARRVERQNLLAESS